MANSIFEDEFNPSETISLEPYDASPKAKLDRLKYANLENSEIFERDLSSFSEEQKVT